MKQTNNKLKNALATELLNEWEDFLDTEYFIGCLYELTKASIDGLIELIQ